MIIIVRINLLENNKQFAHSRHSQLHTFLDLTNLRLRIDPSQLQLLELELEEGRFHIPIQHILGNYTDMMNINMSIKILYYQLPLARASLYAQGSNLHVAIWPGSVNLTKDITRFVAMEGRTFCLSAGG